MGGTIRRYADTGWITGDYGPMSHRLRPAAGLVAALALLLAACGSASTGSPSAPGSPRPAASTGRPANATLTAAQVAARFAADGIPLTVVADYTAATDPNSLLGRPGGYTSKVAFTDPRVADSDRSSEAGATENGGSLEVFPDQAGAAARATYIEGVTGAAPSVLGEYDFQRRTVVVRVSRFLSPDQAADYNKALQRLP